MKKTHSRLRRLLWPWSPPFQSLSTSRNSSTACEYRRLKVFHRATVVIIGLLMYCKLSFLHGRTQSIYSVQLWYSELLTCASLTLWTTVSNFRVTSLRCIQSNATSKESYEFERRESLCSRLFSRERSSQTPVIMTTPNAILQNVGWVRDCRCKCSSMLTR